MKGEGVTRLAEILLQRGWMTTVAESCTGGWVSKVFTDLAGSSQWFIGGFITYSNFLKHQCLAVPLSLIEQHGAVSTEVASAMATGAKQVAAVEVSLAITGIAGPDGGTLNKPVGTVCFAWVILDAVYTENCYFAGNRASVRQQAVQYSVDKLVRLLENKGSTKYVDKRDK